MKTITAPDLNKNIENNEDFILIDVLSKESYQAKHIPKSINIPVDEITDRAEKELPDKEKPIVVYCASKTCNASPSAVKKLEEMGYKEVLDYEDGLAGWLEAGFALEGDATEANQ